MPMTPEQEQKVDDLTELVGLVNDQLADLRKKARRRTIILTVSIVVAVVAAVTGILVGARGVSVGHSAEADLRASQHATQQARVASCKQFNLQQTKNVDTQIQLSEDFVAALVSGATNPATLARARQFNAAHDALIRRKYPLRDCTTAGIAQYLSTPTTR